MSTSFVIGGEHDIRLIVGGTREGIWPFGDRVAGLTVRPERGDHPAWKPIYGDGGSAGIGCPIGYIPTYIPVI